MNTIDPFGMCADPEQKNQEEEIRHAAIERALTDIRNAEQRYDRIQDSANLAMEEVKEAQLYLQSICIHQELEIEKKYFEGSYLDRAYTKMRNKCKICGTVGDWETEIHSWYG